MALSLNDHEGNQVYGETIYEFTGSAHFGDGRCGANMKPVPDPQKTEAQHIIDKTAVQVGRNIDVDWAIIRLMVGAVIDRPALLSRFIACANNPTESDARRRSALDVIEVLIDE